jgi:hypothetical protein
MSSASNGGSANSLVIALVSMLSPLQGTLPAGHDPLVWRSVDVLIDLIDPSISISEQSIKEANGRDGKSRKKRKHAYSELGMNMAASSSERNGRTRECNVDRQFFML